MPLWLVPGVTEQCYSNDLPQQNLLSGGWIWVWCLRHQHPHWNIGGTLWGTRNFSTERFIRERHEKPKAPTASASAHLTMCPQRSCFFNFCIYLGRVPFCAQIQLFPSSSFLQFPDWSWIMTCSQRSSWTRLGVVEVGDIDYSLTTHINAIMAHTYIYNLHLWLRVCVFR